MLLIRPHRDVPAKGKLNPVLFWDVDNKQLMLWRDRIFILSRALQMANLPGMLDDIEKIYPKDEIKKAALSRSSFRSNEIHSLLSERYGIPMAHFVNYHN